MVYVASFQESVDICITILSVPDYSSSSPLKYPSTWLEYHSYYICLLPTFIQLCESIAEKSLENEFWTKGNYSWKSWSIVLEVELDL